MNDIHQLMAELDGHRIKFLYPQALPNIKSIESTWIPSDMLIDFIKKYESGNVSYELSVQKNFAVEFALKRFAPNTQHAIKTNGYYHIVVHKNDMDDYHLYFLVK